MISYQTVVGTPGQPGAYTSFTATEETVYYFSYETPDMGNTYRVMDFGSITNSLPTNNTSGNNGQNYNTTLNNFLDSHGFTYYYSSVNFKAEGQTIEGFKTTSEYSPSDDPYTKAINFFYASGPSGYIQKTVNSSGTFSVWYGCTSGTTNCTITKNGAVEDSVTTGDSDNRRRRVDIQVEAGDVIKIQEAWNIMLLYAVIYPYAIEYPGT
jgi:hypothetical protein